MIKCLITGTEGMLGSVLTKKLIENKEISRVFGIDACYFGENVHDDTGKYMLIPQRVENIEHGWGYWLDYLKPDVVVSLAAISNDPASELNPSLTKIINHFSVVSLAIECQIRKIKFIFASSASVYGAVDYDCSVWSPCFPISLYAKEKLETERDLWSMANDDWQPVIFRMSTLFGSSPRFRLDLAVNKMIFDAITSNKITVYGGQQYRPFLDVNNAADEYVKSILSNETEGYIKNLCDFNVKIIDLANFIGAAFSSQVEVKESALDSRNYRIREAKTDSIYGLLIMSKRFDEIRSCINNIKDPSDSVYYTVKRIKEMMDSGNSFLQA